jgi:hypothetical protein
MGQDKRKGERPVGDAPQIHGGSAETAAALFCRQELKSRVGVLILACRY